MNATGAIYGVIVLTALAVAWAAGFVMGTSGVARLERAARPRSQEPSGLPDSHAWALLLDGESTCLGCAVCGISREEAGALGLSTCARRPIRRAEWRARARAITAAGSGRHAP